MQENGTALHSAKSAAVVKALLAAGAEVDAQVTVGWTPLCSACHFGRVEVVAALIAGGADVNVDTGTGQTALMIASMYGYSRVARLLVAADADAYPNWYGKRADGWAVARGFPSIAAIIHAGPEAARAAIAAEEEEEKEGEEHQA
eukprot:PLAT604.1.p1 GENE.PLAT604.1~~PLAT604.1.p1  ORF type:complete len:145 (+),score=33.54 PLAT604.1:378-812(+)